MNEISGLWALIDLYLLIVCRISKLERGGEGRRGKERASTLKEHEIFRFGSI